MTGNDPEVGHLTGSHQEVAVEGQKLEFCVRLSSYRAVTGGGASHMIGNDVK